VSRVRPPDADPARTRAERRGRRAERLCRLALLLSGWRVVAADVRTPAGQIDLVARRGGVLAIVEVKARPTLDEAAGAVSARQRDRLARAARAFLAGRPELARLAVRFDAMLVAPGRWPRRVADAWRPEGHDA
jgi:putative endonuclease